MSSSLFSSFQENTKCESSFFADTCTRRVPIFLLCLHLGNTAWKQFSQGIRIHEWVQFQLQSEQLNDVVLHSDKRMQTSVMKDAIIFYDYNRFRVCVVESPQHHHNPNQLSINTFRAMLPKYCAHIVFGPRATKNNKAYFWTFWSILNKDAQG